METVSSLVVAIFILAVPSASTRPTLDGDGELVVDQTRHGEFIGLQRGRLSMETVSGVRPRAPGRRLKGLQRGRLSMETVSASPGGMRCTV